MKPHSILLLSTLPLFLLACQGEDEQVRTAAEQAGVSRDQAAELSRMELAPEEVEAVRRLKGAGVDDVAVVRMVKALHERDLKFTYATDIEQLKGMGMEATPMVELVELGAVPRMTDDVRAMKDAGISDATIVEVARLGMKEKKALLSGNEYALLKRAGLSDAAVLTFVRSGGDARQAQTVIHEMALGKPEPEAMKAAGL